MLAAVADWVLASPIAFLVGAAVGFVASNRYRIVKRNGKGGEE